MCRHIYRERELENIYVKEIPVLQIKSVKTRGVRVRTRVGG